MEDLGVLVMSCDKNIWLLDIFFECFYLAGGDYFENIYVCLENTEYYFKDRVLKVINNDIRSKWSQRLKKSLDNIKEDNILLFLDDFIIEEPINFQLIKRYVKYLKEESLNNIILTPVENEKNSVDLRYPRLEHRSRFGRYKTSLQCGLWKKVILSSLIDEKENAWEFEIFSNIRSFIYPDKFYAVKASMDKPIIYNNGFFMVQGKINLDEKSRLEKKLGRELEIANVTGFYEKNMVRDNINFWPRVNRRIKIMFYYCVYKIRYICGNKKTFV